jgi:uncharacterized phage-associated protein
MSLEFNIQSFIQPVLYILNKAGKPLDTHKISKILYFADREHLAKYGTTISGDTYMKMQYGPVPSTVYDIIKTIQGRKGIISTDLVSPFLAVVDGSKIIAVSNFDADEFSQTEMECLDESVKSYLTKSFDFLTNHSHDEAWMDATYTMDELKIAKAGGADRKMLNYIKEHNELVNARFY